MSSNGDMEMLLVSSKTKAALKEHGVNVAADFLLHLAEYGTRSGLVLVSCEDPGALSSINEGDSLLMRAGRGFYQPLLALTLRHSLLVLGVATVLLVLAGALASRMGSEFLPQLDEHDLAARLDDDVLGLEVAVVGEVPGVAQLLQRADDREEPVQADPLEGHARLAGHRLQQTAVLARVGLLGQAGSQHDQPEQSPVAPGEGHQALGLQGMERLEHPRLAVAAWARGSGAEPW